MANENHSQFRKQAQADHSAKLRARLASGGDAAQDKAMISAAIHKHEKNDHPGTPLTKLKTGGAVDGGAMKPRLDRARGGRTKHKGGHKTVVNVVMPQGQDKPVPVPVPMGGPPPGAMPPGAGGPPPGMPMGAGAPPPRPPMGPPVGAGVPMQRKAGGRVGRRADGGSVPDDDTDAPTSRAATSVTAREPTDSTVSSRKAATVSERAASDDDVKPRQAAEVKARALSPYARGGVVPKVAGEAGAGAGLGRLEKMKAYGARATGNQEDENFTDRGENRSASGKGGI